MKNKLIRFLLLFTFIFSTQAYTNPISKINFIGLNFHAEATMLEILPFKIGQNFSQNISDKIINDFFNTGFFSEIKIAKEANDLNITLTENPFIKQLEFNTKSDSGISAWLKNETDFISIETLKDLAIDKDISTGDIYTKKKLSSFISFIENKYSEAGYFNANIEFSLDTDLQNRIGIKFNINQGNRATIDTLNLKGNNLFTDRELLKLFTLGEPDIFPINYFTNKDQFTDSEFRDGLDLMTNKYFSEGHLDFKILAVDTKLSDNKEKIFIEINILEGIKYKLGDVSFEGELGNQDPDSLKNILTMKTGDTFNRSLIMEDIQNLTDIFSDQGYAFVTINPVTSDFLDSINVNFVISLNKQVYINRITISGNTRTQDEVIRREIGISEGGLYSRSTLRKSINKLRRLGYFSDVQMLASEVPNLPDKINLDFIVEETKTGSVSFSVSHSNNYGVSLGAGIKEKNIFGSGNTLNSELKLSDSFNRISFYFENPNFNDKQHSISFGAFMSEITDDDVMKDSYEINTTGVNIGYGIPLTEDTRINTRLEYSKNEIKCGTSFATLDYESTQCASKNNDEMKLTTSWKENTLNNYLNPTDGRSNAAIFGIALPLGDYRYFNINTSHVSYTPINSNLTLKLNGSLDLAKGYSGKTLPFFKRYFGGGSGSVRGFGNKTLGPQYLNKSAKGGELSILGSANLITPAFFFNDNENMRMSAFIDAGNIYEKTSSIKLNDLRMSAGVGFAYLSPIGAIGMYWSTPILKKSGDTIENFGFSMGTGF